MTNRDCLDGVRCPNCSRNDRFTITAIVACEVTDDGSEPVGDHEWDDASSTRCPECGRAGLMREFRERGSRPPIPTG